jgi:DNA-binding IclR family transcriptional regulator
MPKTTLEAELVATEPRPNSKTAAVLEQLRRAAGTTLDELIGATGWQRHTTRAVLSGLKKKGHAVERQTVDGVSRYRIAEACGR